MPFRDNPKPEQVIEFFGHALSEAFEQTDCVYRANQWLREMAGMIDIVYRDVHRNYYGKCVGIIIWYRERV